MASYRRAALVVLGLGCALRLGLACLGVRDLVGICLADDLFYYLEIARRSVAGQGITFDGMTHTNGFHPLHLLLVRSLVVVLGDAERAIPALLAVLAVASAVIGVSTWRIVRTTAGEGPALAATAVWCLSPPLLLTTSSGLEAPLSLMFTSVAWERWLTWRPQGPLRVRRAIVLGALTGLAILARTDAGLFGLALAFEVARHTLRLAGGKAAAIRLGALGLTTLVVTSPWWLWSLATLGTLRQNSEVALSLRAHTVDQIRSAGSALGTMPRGFSRLGLWLGTAVERWGLPFGALLPAGVLVLARWRRAPARASGAAALWLPALALAVFYAFHLGFVQNWYVLSTCWLATLLLGWGAAELEGWLEALPWGPPWTWLGLTATIAVASLVTLPGQVRHSVYPWQRAMLEQAEQLKGVLPADAPVAAFNAGIFAFFSGRPVINLEGVANAEVIPWLRERRLLGYLHHRRIRYVVDFDRTLRTYSVFGEPGYAVAFRIVASRAVPAFHADLVVVEVVQ